MYSVYYEPQDGGRFLLFSPPVSSKGYVLIDPKISMQVNRSSTMRFTMQDSHPRYSEIKPFSGLIKAYDGAERIFCGRVLSCQRDFYRQKAVVCEGELSFLNDVLLPLNYTFNGTISAYLTDIFAKYNASAHVQRRFTFGGTDLTDSVEIEYKTPTSCWSALQNLIKSNPGYFVLSVSGSGRNEVTTIRYNKASGVLDSQSIVFGKNLIDMTDFLTAANFYSVMFPTGATVNNAVVTIASVNSGSNFLIDNDALSAQGRVEKQVSFSDAKTPSELLAKAQAQFSEDAKNAQTLTISAMDLHLLNAEVSRFKLGNIYKLISAPHGYTNAVENQFPLTKIELPLSRPDRAVYTFGHTKQTLIGGLNGVNKP